ncbi:MAG TPA: GGDEF domain-containing protein [Thermoguttaceae bacterium]|nr:GGDEF domain-containing protein [Thermoguttaceae bacterium]
MLAGSETVIWLSRLEIPPSAHPDVVVTDRDLPGHRDPEILPGKAPPTLVGVVKIGGGQGRADVALPEDVTARELRLACRLLAQIVRLRRREKSAAQSHRRLAEQALTDPLTGLPNRRAWQDGLEERLARIAGPEGPRSQRLCVAVLDLDHFKRVNDTHGHAVGDEVLRASGRSIRESLRQDDFVARLGGDEFGLLLWVPDEPTAASVVDRVRTTLPPRLIQAATHAITASAGYHVVASVESPATTLSADTVYSVADAAMHEAKRLGRDRTVAYEDLRRA